MIIPTNIDDQTVTSIGGEAFCDSGLTNVTIPNSVTNIVDSAYSDCLSLTNVTIGANVTSIRNYAFAVCTNLTSLYFQGNAPSAGYNMFNFINVNATVYYLPSTTGWVRPVMVFPRRRISWG